MIRRPVETLIGQRTMPALRPAGARIAADYLQKILTARVYDVAVETPLTPAKNLSRRIGMVRACAPSAAILERSPQTFRRADIAPQQSRG